MSVRVRDLEIALVLAREMKAAAARSVDASLRLDQLQEVFGVERLDRAERARIQTALQMAGLEPFPSLLEADPAEPIRFGASKAAAGVTAAGGSGEAEAGAAAGVDAPDGPPAVVEPAPTFPTVGEFARSKLGRSRGRRRFGLRRGDHGEDATPPPPPPPVEEEEYGGSNGWAPEDDATQVHHEVLPEAELEEEPVAEVAEEVELEPHEPEPVAQVEEELEPHDPEPVAEVEEELEPHESEPVAEVEAELEPHDPEPVAEAEDEREYIPLVPEQPVSYVPPPDPATPPSSQPPGARGEDLVAALLPAVAIPVIVTSLAGWRFGLPFVALSVIATGWLLSRRKPADGQKRGLFATLRSSPAAATALKTTAVVTVLSGVAAVVLATLNKDSSSSTSGNKTASPPAKKPQAKQPTTAAKPATSSKPPTAKEKKKPAAKTPPTSTTANQPPPDPATQGLIRVPPQSSSTQGTGPNGTGGTATQPAPTTPAPPATGQPTP
jgi:chemotaxis protein histidine kinase CheA